MHQRQVSAKRPGNLPAILRSQLLLSLQQTQLPSRKARHQGIAPAKDVGCWIDQIWPGCGHMDAFMKQACVKLFGRKLPGEMRSATQDELAATAGNKHVLPKYSKRNLLGYKKIAEIEAIEGGLKLCI